LAASLTLPGKPVMSLRVKPKPCPDTVIDGGTSKCPAIDRSGPRTVFRSNDAGDSASGAED
jgi:hypothetical protein